MSTFDPIIMRNGKPAIDVKDHHLYARDPLFARFYDELGEDAMNAVFEGVQQDFWDHYAPEISREFGYGDVFAEGRSGGWLMVSNPPVFEPDEYCAKCGHAVLLPFTDDDVICEDGDCGHVQPHGSLKLILRWNAFEKRIDAQIEDCRELVATRLAQTIDEREAETREAAEMAARDIITVPS